MFDIAYTVSGFVVGFIVGVTGVGGGSLMTPLLMLVFGVNPAVAVGTDLLYAAITKTGGGWVHQRRGTVDWKIAGLLAAGSLPAALLTIALLQQLAPDTKQLSALITGTLGFALILTALALIFKDKLRRYGAHRGHVALQGRSLATATVVTGMVLGVMVTISSVGAGALGMVVLFFLYPHAPTARLVGTDIVHAVPLTAVAGIGHVVLGTVDYGLLGSLLLGSLPGIYFGSHLGASIPDKILRPILATMLMLIGGKLIL